ncbi:hypothetical protein Deima_0148 [Deinococcus maricopensis DSM 21211]|uniref:O-antigen polymerase n=1 Tax=Deinococcus maricopensis (strain DSM 21211 / LMG 22137 / NRRL B-23946 / LB-34) TaxID=709986 RepID=E8U3E1_DEIML|nr:hypothetical protein Deima_0148 [Deinococcus maricopensis DSM 21211]
MYVRRDTLDIWLHAALFSLYLGTLSVIGTASRLGLGSVSMLGLILLTLTLTASAAWRARSVPLLGVTLLGALPFAHLAVGVLGGGSTDGSFVYLYKFSGYLLIPYLWVWACTRTDERIERTLMLIATFIAVRALATFVLPALGRDHVGLADDFIIWERVGPLARVFFPGQGLMFLGLMIALRGVFVARGQDLKREGLRAALFMGALGVTFSRGSLIFAALLATLFILVRFARQRAASSHKARLVLGALMALNAAGVAVFLTPLATPAGQFVTQFRGQERFSLDPRNLDWRAEQVRAARLLIRTDEDRAFGVGTATHIPEDVAHPIPGQVTNELHYSYASVQWTFGNVGLALLAVFGIAQPLLRAAIRRPATRLALPAALTLAYIALCGAYTITFTSTDWSFMLALCGAYLNARSSRHAPPAVPAPPRPARFPKGLLHD